MNYLNNDLFTSPPFSPNSFFWVSRLIIVIYFSSVATGILQFHIWPQIWDIQNQPLKIRGESNIHFYHIFTNSHAIRYLLIRPILTLSEFIHLHPNKIFSICIAVLVTILAGATAKSSALLIEKPDQFRLFFILNMATMIFISCFMNGRLMWSLSGLACIQHTLLRINQNEPGSAWSLPIILIGLFFCSVSTGTFILAVAVVYSWLMLYFLKVFGQKSLSLNDITLALLLLLTLYCLHPLIDLYIGQNIAFFGEGLTGLFEMLNHGAGKIIITAGAMKTVGILIFLAGYGYIFLYIWKRYKSIRFLMIIITLCSALGLLGYSILILTIIPSLCLLNIATYRFLSNRQHSYP